MSSAPAAQAREADYAVQGVTCAACIGVIEGAVTALPGSPSARLNYATRRLRVSWTDEAFEPARIGEALKARGYVARPFEMGALEREDAAQMQFLLRCLAVAGFAAMNIMLLSVSVWAGEATSIDAATRDLFHWISALIALPAAAYAGRPFFFSAARALRARSLNMDVPISLGVTVALAMSVAETARGAAHAYFDSALMLLFFLLLGRTLDAAMRRRTRSVAANLASPARGHGDADAPRRRPDGDAGLGAESRATASMCAPATGCPPTGASRSAPPTSTTASSPARRGAATSRRARWSMPARSTSPPRWRWRSPPRARARCSTRSSGCWRTRPPRSRVTSASPTAFRASMRRSCTRRR